MATSIWRKFQNIYLGGTLKLKKGAKIERDDQVVTVTASAVTLNPQIHGNGRTVALNRAAGIAVTLPGATGSGDKYRLVLVTAVTSNTTVVDSAVAADDLTGLSVTGQAGTANAWPSGATADTFTLNGSTQGGLEGDVIEIEDVAANLYSLNHTGSATGTEATPWS